MIWEVHARLLFTEEDEARDFFHDCENAFTTTTYLHPGTPHFEPSTAMLIQNHHDENPVAPCTVLMEHNNPPGGV